MSTKQSSLLRFRLKRNLERLAAREGRGTELVSLYVPPGRQVSEVVAMLNNEYGTASNIKSNTTRKNVQDAITRVTQRMKIFKKVPENGLVLFCGAIPQNGPGSEKIELLPPGSSLDKAEAVFGSLEDAALSLDGVESVDSFVLEEGDSLAVKLVDEEDRPEEISVVRVRDAIREEARRVGGVIIRTQNEAGGGGGGRSTGAARALGQAPTEVIVSGAESARLKRLADDISARLSSIPEIAWSAVSSRAGQEEIHLLTMHEIDRRIESVWAEVSAVDTADSQLNDSVRPRWIAAAELVRRMRPFIVLN